MGRVFWLENLKGRDFFFFKGTVLRGPLAYHNELLDLHIETFGRTPWPGDQPDATNLPLLLPLFI
jgi:hypothetical protein